MSEAPKHAEILVFDEDLEAWEKLRSQLEKIGYSLFVADSYEEGMDSLSQKQKPDLILVDSNTNKDYIEIVRQVKEVTHAPVIVIHDQDDSTEAIVSMELGADDFISKPFQIRELTARIKANLRLFKEAKEQALEELGHEKESGGQAVIHFGNWVLDRDKMQVLDLENQPIDFTHAEYELLEALVLSSGKVMSRERLFELTRHGEFEAYDRAIDILVARIRKKLGDCGDNPKFLKTVRGAGYMLDVDLQKAG